jgi:hypothetical protein
MDNTRGSVEDIDIARTRRAWESATRHVTRLYAELERAIVKAGECETAYNVAVRAANLRHTDAGAVAVLALLGLVS